jgi:glycosyltransferase involved in cell wall biosynthesis
MRFCESLSKAGIETVLAALKVKLMKSEQKYENLWTVYGISTPFKIKMFPTLLRQKSSDLMIGFYRLLWYTLYAFYLIVIKRETEIYQPYIVYGKNFTSLLFPLLLKRVFRMKLVVVMESHILPENILKRWVLNQCDRIIANSYTLAGDLAIISRIKKEKILGTHQGINLEHVENMRISRLESRTRLHLPLDKRIVACTGKVYWGYREIELLLETASLLPSSVLMQIVGGRADHVERYRRRILKEHRMNVQFVGFVPPADVYNYQFAADVLVSYYPSGLLLNRYRSPGKLFDYMASKTPVIAADYVSLREILHEGENAILVEPDSPEQLAGKIKLLLSDASLRERLAGQALIDVQEYTWDKRAERVIHFINNI